MKKTGALFCALALVATLLTGCSLQGTTEGTESRTAAVSDSQCVTLIDTETLKIELEGTKTRVYDLVGGETFAFETRQVFRTEPLTLAERQARALGATVADTSTVKVVVAGGTIVVTDRTKGTTYYIEH